ncbi:hypothetical protein IU485_27965 [Nocardia cyriacigeorgica]|uniref:phage terminase small subunit n=1 Tax=Nocardia cyriacigeorgica TaxID=135487 RepID=UPI0018945B01|nr:hypothetical protein [Nocardia cyriacigeorgica]MBF6085209.1 hypothetical protein [Nocardia cyriacigeorgica]
MAGRRPGPPPKPPEQRARTNADPYTSGDGWTEIPPDPYDGDVPPIPAWVPCSDEARALYAELAALPQARLWGPGTWLELHLSLPAATRYLNTGSGEGLKALLSAWGVALRLTEDDLTKARIKVAVPAEEDDVPGDKKVVSFDQERRARLTQRNAS